MKPSLCEEKSVVVPPSTLNFCLLIHVGSAVLVTTTTDMDKTGASYYGEQGLHYLSMRGDGNMVPLGME